MRVLLIEDDTVFAEILKQSLIDQNYAVDIVNQGQAGLDYAQAPGASYDLFIIDVGLPILDGITLSQKLRESGDTTPILLMTARNTPAERILALDKGADEYLTKPFDLEEFHARLRALRRRGDQVVQPVLKLGDLELDPAERQVTYAHQPLKLTPKEYGLLELLLRHPGRAFSKGEIVEHLWSFDDPPLEDTVKSHIKSLRHKLKIAGASDWIENIYGMGYRLNPHPERGSDAILGDDPIETTPLSASNVGQLIPPRPEPTVEAEFQAGLAILWQQYQGEIRERLGCLQALVQALQSARLTTLTQSKALQAAHKLAGVLGMFGLDEETQIASRIEGIIETLDDRNLNERLTLQDQVQRLVNRVNRVLPDTNAEPILRLRSEPTIPPAPVIEAPPTTTFQNVFQNLVQDWRILVVDDDPIVVQVLNNCLSTWGMQVIGLQDPRQFWEILPQVAPDLVILDVAMPHIDGITLCREIRDAPEWQAIPVIFLTRHKDSAIVQDLFIAGADDYVVKPVVSAELVARITNRLERLRLLQSLSTKDNLTGLANYAQSARSLSTLLEEHPSACLVLLVWPELHAINLEYGHRISHRVLRQWGQLIRAHFAEPAIAGYWGDGEFVMGVSQGSLSHLRDRVFIFAEALGRQVFSPIEEVALPIVCAWAIAEYPKQGENLQALYQSACQSLII